jgi:monoamine oxidase
MSNKRFDYTIVGAGVSGLETARRLSDRYPEAKICVLEKLEQAGGRLKTERFHGFRVPHGGSMIRESDSRVMALCKELGLEVRAVEGNLQSAYPDFVNNMLRDIASRTEKMDGPMSVERFLREGYPLPTVNKFLENSIYRDFLRSDLSEFINTYPVSDLLQPEGVYNQPYVCKGGFGALIDTLLGRIQSPNVVLKTNARVTSVGRDKQGWTLEMEGQKSIRTRYLIWATAIDDAVKVLPPPVSDTLTRYIEGVPFLRAAGFVNNDFTFNRVVGGLLGKVFPLKGGVFQLAYTEDQAADTLHRLLTEAEAKGEGRLFLTKLLRNETGVSDLEEIVDYTWTYWKSGIHVFKTPVDETPLNRFDGGLYVVGEMVSLENKGWVEGALQSVDDLFALMR